MGKRSSFDRVERDFYPTPYEAVVPLLSHLTVATKYHEPCAGDGALQRHLAEAGHEALWCSDIAPRQIWMSVEDARDIRAHIKADCFITNPPWDRNVLHPIIANLARQLPTWLLFDADWMHTRQSAPFLPLLRKIVSIGRVKWIPDSKMTGKDNCCWYLFDASSSGAPVFFGRAS